MNANTLIANWAGLNPEKNKQFELNSKVFLRWLSQAQKSHCEKSELVKAVKTLTFEDGMAQLPEDFLRVKGVPFFNRIPLNRISYADGMNLVLSAVYYYSIKDGKMFLWSPASGDMTIQYVASPDDLSNVKSDESIFLPQECNDTLMLYLDAMWARTKDDNAGYLALMSSFDVRAKEDGWKYRMYYEEQPTTWSGQ